MARDAQLHLIFIASPGGLTEERKAFREAVEDFNMAIAFYHRVWFLPIGWEDVPAGAGNAQERILLPLRECDYFVLLLWDRWGTPPGDAGGSTSGTEAEYKEAVECFEAIPKVHPLRDIAIFFKAIDPARLIDPGPQLEKVLTFKEKLETEQKFMYRTFDSGGRFHREVFFLLSDWLRKLEPGRVGITTPPSPMGPILDRSLEEPSERDDGPLSPELKEAERLASENRVEKAIRAFAAATANDDPVALNRSGLFLMKIGQLTMAQNEFQRLLRVPALLPHWQARAASGLGTICKIQGKYFQAEQMFRNAIELERQADHLDCMADQYANIGVILKRRGALDGAEHMQNRALEINQQLKRTEALAVTYGNLGVIFRKRKKLDEAEGLLWKSIELGQHSKVALARAYGNLGILYRQKDPARADELFQKSLELNRSLGSLAGMAIQHRNRGLLCLQRGDLEPAKEMLEKSLELNERLDDKNGRAKQHASLGDLYAARQDNKNARDHWMMARDLYHQIESNQRVQELQARLDRLTPQ